MSSITSSPIVECAIGIVLLWFLAATLCSLVVELIASLFHFRGNQLWREMSRFIGSSAATPGVALADGARLAKTIKAEGAVMKGFIASVPGVTEGTISKVTHVSSAVAAQALVAARSANQEPFAATQLGALVKNLPSAISDDESKLRDWFEHWYDGAMTTVSQSYRKNVRWWTALVGLIIAVGFGLDSIAVVQQLYRSPSERALVVAEAQTTVTPNTNGTTPDNTGAQCTGATFEARLQCAQKAADSVTTLNVSVWQTAKTNRNSSLLIALGILASSIAMAAGAPFWFDLLKRLTGLRSPPPAQAGA